MHHFGIEQLLGDVPLSQFMEQYYLKLPFARLGGGAALLECGNWRTIAAILEHAGTDVLVGREGQPWTGQPPTSLAAARELLNDGYTLGIRQAEKHDPSLAALAKAFERAFAAAVDIHIYCTPAKHPGFGWHYDAEDVFLVQTAGSKEWQLRKNTVNPWPLVETIPANMRHEAELMPVLRCRLEQGDWLYIPPGYWHRSQADEESISLSIGVMSTTAIEVFDFMRTQLLSSLRWRQRLPTLGQASPHGPEELLQQYQEILTELGQDLARMLADPATARALIERKRHGIGPGSEPASGD